MFAIVECFYKEGLHAHHQHPFFAGHLVAGDVKGVPVLNLWPVTWIESAHRDEKLITRLWRPELRSIRDNHMLIWGIEVLAKHGHTRSYAQTWRVEPTTNRGVESYLAQHSRRPSDLRIVKE